MTEGINIKDYNPIIVDEAYSKNGVVRVQTNMVDPKTWQPAFKELPIAEVILIRRVSSPDAEDVLEKIVELSGEALQRYDLRIDASVPKEEFDKLDIEIGEGCTIIHGNTARYPVLRDEKGYKPISAIKLNPDGEGDVKIEAPNPLEREAMAHLLDTPKDALAQILMEGDKPSDNGLRAMIREIAPKQDRVVISYGILPKQRLDECGADSEKIAGALLNSKNLNFGLIESISIPVLNGTLLGKEKLEEQLRNYFNERARQFSLIPVPQLAAMKLGKLKGAGGAMKRTVDALYDASLEDVEQDILPLELCVLETVAKLRLKCRRMEAPRLLAEMKKTALEEQKKEKAETEKAMRKEMEVMRLEIQEQADSYLNSLVRKQ